MLRSRRPPGYRRAQPVRRPKLDAFTGIIDQTRISPGRRSGTRRSASAYARSTGSRAATRSWTCARSGWAGRRCSCRWPIRQATPADFGEALVVIAVDCKAHDLVVDLPHSDTGLCRRFRPRRRRRSATGHAAFATSVACRGDQHEAGGGADSRGRHAPADARTPIGRSLGRPGKGRQRKVEGLVGYARRLLRAEFANALNGAQVRRTSRAPGGTRRRSGSASPATARRCCRYRRSRMTPATRGRREYEFGHTSITAEWIRDVFETTTGRAVASNGFLRVTHALSPRWRIAGRYDVATPPDESAVTRSPAIVAATSGKC